MTRQHGLRLVVATSLAAGLLSGSAWAAVQPQQAPPTAAELPELIKLKDDVYVIQNRNSVVSEIGRFGSNVAIILTPEGVILVDSKNASMHDDIVQKVKSLTNLPIKYVILTHNHGDHSGGAEKMKAIGATVVISDADRENMVRSNMAGLPQLTYSGHAKIYLGGKELQLTEHRGHTLGDTVVYFPAQKIIMAGDLVDTPDTIPARVEYGDGGSWSDLGRALDELAKVDFDLMIGGHGPVLTKAQFLTFKAKLDGIRERFRALNREKKSPEEIGQTLMREFNWGGPGPGAANIPGMMQELK